MQAVDETGLGLAFGSSDEGREWIGRRSPARKAEAAVSEAMIRYYCSLVEDGNPAYWESGISPPGMLMTHGFPLQWRPSAEARPSLFAMEVPLPGNHVINVETDTEFHRQLEAGDRVTVEEEVVDVSPEKQTRLGLGHFVTTRSTYRDQHGNVVAINTNVMFRYATGDAG